MSDNPVTPPDGEAANSAVRFERSDVEANGILVFAGSLALFILLSAVGMWLFLLGMSYTQREEKKPQDYWTRTNPEERVPPFTRPQLKPTGEQSELNRDPHSQLPPRPYLEDLRLQDPMQMAGPVREISIGQQVAEEEQRLANYGWVTLPEKGVKGIAHIPIEQAMQRLVSQKRPAGNSDTVPEFYQAPSRSSSGQRPRGGGS
jgi:hypothetical protein